MIKLAENKAYTEHKPIERMPLSSKVYIPLSQHLGKPCNSTVKVGDAVKTGSVIATLEAGVFSPIHSSVSGKVAAIQDWPHPVLGRAKAIVIESDGKDESAPYAVSGKPHEAISGLSADEIRKIVFNAGVVGMGGASFPTYIKLNPPKTVDTFVVNGAECEPYLTCDYRLMVEKAKEILLGVDLVVRCLEVKDIYIAIEDNKSEAIKLFKDAIRNTTYAIRILKSMYPQGGEKQLIKNVLGKEVPSGKLPFDIGVVVHNVGTIFAIFEAVYLNKPLTERVVTVTGGCIENPRNLLVRIGTPIKELMNFCGPLKEDPAKIIIGGPMMGIAQYTDEVPVIKSTTGVLLLNQKEAAVYEEEFCIRCGACVRECPVGLMPCLINLASDKENWALSKNYGVLDCIECGVCSYVCPANRRLVQSIKRAKMEATKK